MTQQATPAHRAIEPAGGDPPKVAPPSVDMAKFIVEGFLARYKPGTRQGYSIALRQWCAWCAAHDVYLLDAQRAHIEAWSRHLDEERGLKKTSVAAKLNAVCGMYRFASCDGYILADPGANVRRPKIDFISTTNGLNRPQLADILRAAEASTPNTYALICLLALNGLRIGECLASDVTDLGFSRGYRTLNLPSRKGGKVGILSLAVRTTWAIEQSLNGRQSGPLLLGRNGKRLKVGAARRTVRRLCRQIGVNIRITPHSLRHSFVTIALDANVPERDIIDSTGHTDTKMLRYYDRNRGGIERNATHAVAAFIGAA